MAVHALDRTNLDHFMERIEGLSADSERRFGTMDVTKMMRHMRNAFETSLGETDLPDESKPILRDIIYFTICYVMTTWPGGKIKAPDYWSPPPEHEYEEERRLFLDALNRFIDTLESDPHRVGAHPILGPMPLKRWSRLNGIHLHHHLRQFGV